MRHQLTSTIHIFSGILYQLEEEDYETTKHQGFDADQEPPISLEGDLIGRYTRELFEAERTYLVMQNDENPPSVVAKGWDISPAYFQVGTTFYSGTKLLMVTETDADFVTELITKS